MSEIVQEEYSRQLKLIGRMIEDSGGAKADFITKLAEAQESFGIKDSMLGNINLILKFYLIEYNKKKENGNLYKALPKMKKHRNLLIQTNLLTQIHSAGQFLIPGKAYPNSCRRCNGTGELYNFNRTIKPVKCNKCEGGEVWTKCDKCQGNGKYYIEITNERGDPEQLNCDKCKKSPKNHKGQTKITCLCCMGTTVAHIQVLHHSLNSTTPCPVCRSLGFILPKKKKTQNIPARIIHNPVLAGDLAEKLKSHISSNSNKIQTENKVA
jgi:hypothetical protein